MVATRSKTLSLLRAYFNEGYNGSLEEVLKRSFARLPSAQDRIVPIDLISNQFFAGIEASQTGKGVFVRLLEFEQGAIGVVNLDTEDHSAAVEEFFHPDKRDFLKDEMVCYVVDDHIVACNMKNKAGTFCANVLEFASKAEAIGSDVKMRIADVPDKTTLRQLAEIGVKEVDFSIMSFFESLEIDTRRQAGMRVMQMILGVSSDCKATKHRANAVGKMILRRGRFEKDEVHKDEWLTDIGRELMVAGSVEKYTITLEDGTKVSNASLKKTRSVKLKRHANSFAFESAKAELESFYRELVADGALGV